MALFYSKSLNAFFNSAVTSLDKFPADVVEYVEELIEKVESDLIPSKKSKPVTVSITPAITPVVVEATVATDSTVATPTTTA